MSLFIVDAQLPPSLARYLSTELAADAVHVEDLGLRESTDSVIAAAAKAMGAVVITKDHDFVRLAAGLGLAGLVMVTCGNVSNRRLFEILHAVWPRVVRALDAGVMRVDVHDETVLEEFA